jgi:hypothetical protein
MTTLELADMIAHSVIFSNEGEEAATVLRVLLENDSWFCRLHSTPEGESLAEAEERYEMVQPELFK